MKAVIKTNYEGKEQIEINFEGTDIKKIDDLKVIFMHRFSVYARDHRDNIYREDIILLEDKKTRKMGVYSLISEKFILPIEFDCIEIANYMEGFFGQAIIVMKKYDSYIETGVYSLRGEILFPMTKNVMVGPKMRKIVLHGTEVFCYLLVDTLTDESVESVKKIISKSSHYYEYLWKNAKYNKAGIYCIQKKQYVIPPMQNASDADISLSNIDSYRQFIPLYSKGINGKKYKSKEKCIEECGDFNIIEQHSWSWVDDYFFKIYYKKDLTWALYSREGKLIIPPHMYMNIVICKNVIKAVKRVQIENHPKAYVSDYEFIGYEMYNGVELWDQPKYEKVYSYENCFSHERICDLYSYDGKLLSENYIDTYENSKIDYCKV